VSELKRTLLEDIYYPAHEPRKASATYHKTHIHLIRELDEPCWICGIRNSDVQKITDPVEKRRWQLETHHDELEWAAVNGVDPTLVMRDWPELTDMAKLREWLDSEGNMLVLCAAHHRGSRTGVHSVTYPAWKLQRLQAPDGFQFIVQPSKPEVQP
jgi:hypothetical protein